MDPGSSPGVTGTEGPRICPAPFRHSGLDLSLPRSAVRPYSVIPDLTRACPGPDPGESMFIGTRRRKTLRKGRNISGDLQPINMDPGSSPGVTGEEGDMDPGSSPGVTGTEGTRIRPALIPSFQPMRLH
jgi:hypothetical protein